MNVNFDFGAAHTFIGVPIIRSACSGPVSKRKIHTFMRRCHFKKKILHRNVASELNQRVNRKSRKTLETWSLDCCRLFSQWGGAVFWTSAGRVESEKKKRNIKNENKNETFPWHKRSRALRNVFFSFFNIRVQRTVNHQPGCNTHKKKKEKRKGRRLPGGGFVFLVFSSTYVVFGKSVYRSIGYSVGWFACGGLPSGQLWRDLLHFSPSLSWTVLLFILSSHHRKNSASSFNRIRSLFFLILASKRVSAACGIRKR